MSDDKNMRTGDAQPNENPSAGYWRVRAHTAETELAKLRSEAAKPGPVVDFTIRKTIQGGRSVSIRVNGVLEHACEHAPNDGYRPRTAEATPASPACQHYHYTVLRICKGGEGPDDAEDFVRCSACGAEGYRFMRGQLGVMTVPTKAADSSSLASFVEKVKRHTHNECSCKNYEDCHTEIGVLVVAAQFTRPDSGGQK